MGVAVDESVSWGVQQSHLVRAVVFDGSWVVMGVGEEGIFRAGTFAEGEVTLSVHPAFYQDCDLSAFWPVARDLLPLVSDADLSHLPLGILTFLVVTVAFQVTLT